MEKTKRQYHVLKWLLPLLILLLAAVASVMVAKSRRPPAKEVHENPGILVETLTLEATPQRAMIRATGTVRPQQQISLVAEVTGTLTWVSPAFVDGGFFRRGEKLLEIDPRDYQLAVQRARADLARAQAALQTEEEQAALAGREWQRLDLADKGQPSPLVLRQPQLESARAALIAARAGLEQAQLNLERTQILAPFNGRVHDKKVDGGEYVRAGNGLAGFAGTDRAEILVPLPVEDLGWLDIPRAGNGKTGAAVSVSAQSGSGTSTWQGQVIRALGEVDPTSRMTTIVVAVDDPYNLAAADTGRSDLLNGLFVQLEIAGHELGEVIEIPRAALREGNVVWLATADDQLEIRPVKVLRRRQQSLLIGSGLAAGERLVLTSISAPAPGLKLRPQAEERRP
jgi:RND family efflux transporter MFP subunit